MKEIIRVEKFLSIVSEIWNGAIYRDETDGRQHYFELYSTFGDYPDLITFESELINGLPEKAISEKAKTILTKCNELIELYNQLLKGVPVKKEVLQIGKLDTKILTDSEKINMQLYFKDTNNSRLTKLIFDNNDLIRDINHIKKAIETTTTEPPAGTTLHTDLEPTRLDVLYSYLTDEKLIKTTPEMWRYWFTKPSLQAGKQPKKIQWLGAGSVLSNVIMLVCGNFTNHTETAMKAAFKLQSGRNYQQPTPDRNNRGKHPYKRIYEIMEHAETKLQS